MGTIPYKNVQQLDTGSLMITGSWVVYDSGAGVPCVTQDS